MRLLEPEPGVRLAVHRLENVPVCALRLWLPGGATREETPGQAYVTGRLLADGTSDRDWLALSRETEARGAVLSSSAALEAHGLALDALAEDWRWMVDRALDLVAAPGFSAGRLRWQVDQAIAEIRSCEDQPEVVANRLFAEQLYAPHPASRLPQGEPAALRRLQPADCRSFHAAALGRGLVLAVAGEVEEAAVLDHLASRLAEVPGLAAAPAGSGEGEAVAATFRDGEPRRRGPLPAGADQAQLRVGRRTVPRRHPDRLALSVAAVILGAGSGLQGRMPLRLREREGLAYAVQVETVAGCGWLPGRFVVALGTAPERLERAEAAIREELRRFLEEGPDAIEVEEARSFLLGREPFRRETAGQWAAQLSSRLFYGEPCDPGRRIEELRALRSSDVVEAARRHLRPDGLVVTEGLPRALWNGGGNGARAAAENLRTTGSTAVETLRTPVAR